MVCRIRNLLRKLESGGRFLVMMVVVKNKLFYKVWCGMLVFGLKKLVLIGWCCLIVLVSRNNSVVLKVLCGK